MDNTRADIDILQLAIEALDSNTGLKTEILAIPAIQGKSTERKPDAELRLLDSGETYFVEIKRHAQHTNLGSLIDQVKRLPGPDPGLLVADYINSNMAEKLKQAEVQFIDTAGNAYIKRQPIYIIITGKKRRKNIGHFDNSQINRAFEPKGLLVTFAFLENPSLAAKSYREIAQVAGVAVGTVGWVIKALKAGRYLHEEADTGKRRITNYHRLLDRWVSAWPEKLKNKHLLGKFISEDPNWWTHTNIQTYGGCWGGETAAAIYTKHLRPQVATVYIPKENLSKLIRDARLGKASDHGQEKGVLVYLYSPFWTTHPQRQLYDGINQNLLEVASGHRSVNIEDAASLVSPILVYADLIATGDPRNLETAQLLRDEYITEPDRTA